MKVQIAASWASVLQPEFDKPYFKEIADYIKKEIAAGKTILPKGQDIFQAFNTTGFEDVKVVILGQDPYHNIGQAHGLSFSVLPGVATPPSLRNIYKELATDIGFEIPAHGYLLPWAQQGVLLLNAVLTVAAHQANSHAKIGWARLTDAVLQLLSQRKDALVFILWGSYARSKATLIDSSKHLIIEGPHPSPLSAHRGFFGSRPFSKTNDFLLSKGKTPIKWQL